MLKKLITIAIAFVMCLGVAMPAWAADDSKDLKTEPDMSLFPNSEEIQGIADEVRMLLSFDKSMSYNKAEIEIGQQINVYKYENDQFMPVPAVYPVFIGQKLYAVLLGGEGDSKNYFGTMSELVAPMNEHVSRNDEFALIFDKHNCYLYDGYTWTPLAEYKSGIEPYGILDINSDIDTSAIVLNSMKYSYSIGEFNSMELPARSPKVAYISLPLAFVGQDASNICWAACVAAIVNYLMDTDYISLEIAQNYWYGVGDSQWNKPLGINTVTGVLKGYGVLNYKVKSTPNDPNDISDMVYDNIAQNYPVYATFKDDNKNNIHACVIYGVAPGVNRMVAMDPEREYDDPYEISQGNRVDCDDKGFYIFYGPTRLYLS